MEVPREVLERAKNALYWSGRLWDVCACAPGGAVRDSMDAEAKAAHAELEAILTATQ